MQDGIIKVAAATVPQTLANCAANANSIIELARKAAAQSAKILVTSELGITGYNCQDLFLQQQLLDDAVAALQQICRETAALPLVLVVGLPLRHKSKLYNCAAVVCGGHVLGLVPKSYPPNFGEFQELRHFNPAFAGLERCQTGFLRGVLIGTQLLFSCEQLPALTLGVEICEDLWVPAPPSIFHAAVGATIIANLSAGNEVIGKAAWRRKLVEAQSGKLLCGYIYANAGEGESTTDLVFAGHNMIAENGELLVETPPFSDEMALGDVDVDRLVRERQRTNTFPDASGEGYLTVMFPLPVEETPLTRQVNPLPFVPQGQPQLDEYCETVSAIQAAGLKRRMEHTRAEKMVLGISGGLDSTLALLAAADACKLMGRSASDIVALSMPAFGTTSRTRNNAEVLCAALGVTFKTIDLRATVKSHFDDIGHDENNLNVVYENAQARMRTLTLMDLANSCNGLVLGTGDMSELALGWATYNGDHMSMYGVNGSVPKTLIRTLLEWRMERQPQLAEVLRDILDTPVSPELLPPSEGEISQKTEDIVGPYELHDFFLYYTLRWSFTPRKILRLALVAFRGRYSRETILKWMRVFYIRFFSQQFKRSCLPDGPKVGSVSLSPRGDWRMPSDASPAGWLAEVDAMIEQKG